MIRVLSTSRRGRHHVLRREGCEDRKAVLALPGGGVAAAVADGHGDERCMRAGFGAKIAVTAAVSVLSDPGIAAEQLAQEIHSRYLRLCRRHLVFRPLSAHEEELLGGLPPVYAYGTTLACALSTVERTVMLCFGDSEVMAVQASGAAFPALPDDPRCVGNISTSLADPDAAETARWASYDQPAAALLLFTDGYGYRGRLPADLLDMLDRPLPDAFPEEVLANADHGDDQTVVLAASEDLCGTEAFHQGLKVTLERLAAENRIRVLEREMKEIVAFLNLALNALRTRKGQDLTSLALHAREELERLSAMKAEIAALSARL